MLENETEQRSSLTPASLIRVTPEELAAALNALEVRKQEAARHLEGTVPIGEVVREMNLEATPEEVWAQVQKQREQDAREQAAQASAQQAATVTKTVRKTAAVRYFLRGWRGIKGWAWIIFWCSGGLGLLSSVPHLLHHNAPVVGIQISGDEVTGNYNVQGTGPQRDVTVSGDNDVITLRGDVRDLTVSGDDNTVTVIGSVNAVTVDSDGNTIHWTKEIPGKSLQPVISGDGNKVGLSGQ